MFGAPDFPFLSATPGRTHFHFPLFTKPLTARILLYVEIALRAYYVRKISPQWSEVAAR